MKKVIFSVLFIVWTTALYAQGFSINTTGTEPDSCAMLDVAASNKGVLFPRLTTAQRDAIPLPKAGLLLYNTSTNTFDYYTGSAWISLATANTSTPVPIIRTYTSNGTWTKPAGLKYIIVEVVGGGGGGSGTGNSRGNSGSGGGGGGYVKKYISTAQLNENENIVVGSGGGGGSEVGQSGQNGGNSSFGTFCSATGGGGGQGLSYNWQGGSGGTGLNGDINISGNGGSGGGTLGNTGIGISGGMGGSSFFCGAAPGNGLDSNGLNGTNYGGGGSGGSYINSTRRPGGSGSGGVVIITEYY